MPNLTRLDYEERSWMPRDIDKVQILFSPTQQQQRELGMMILLFFLNQAKSSKQEKRARNESVSFLTKMPVLNLLTCWTDFIRLLVLKLLGPSCPRKSSTNIRKTWKPFESWKEKNGNLEDWEKNLPLNFRPYSFIIMDWWILLKLFSKNRGRYQKNKSHSS